MSSFTVSGGRPLRGRITVPGDKSISHRALICAAMARGRSRFEGLSEGGEVRMPFAESPWSPGFGGFTDKFGVPWMINTIPHEGWKPKG